MEPTPAPWTDAYRLAVVPPLCCIGGALKGSLLQGKGPFYAPKVSAAPGLLKLHLPLSCCRLYRLVIVSGPCEPRGGKDEAGRVGVTPAPTRTRQLFLTLPLALALLSATESGN